MFKPDKMQIIGGFEVLGGVLGIQSVIHDIYPYSLSEQPLLLFFTVPIVLIYGLSIIAGIQLLRKMYIGLIFSIICQILHAVNIKILGVKYLCTSVIHFIFYFDSSFNLGYKLSIGGEYALTYSFNDFSFYFGINVVAIVLIVLLLKQKRMLKKN